jgi:LPXTG-motif cell wall-anchored protein
MPTSILVLVGLGILFGVLAFFTFKKSKKVVTPTYEETPKPRLSFDPSVKEPEPTPVPQEPEVVDPVN